MVGSFEQLRDLQPLLRYVETRLVKIVFSIVSTLHSFLADLCYFSIVSETVKVSCSEPEDNWLSAYEMLCVGFLQQS